MNLYLPDIHGNINVTIEGEGEMNDRAQAFANAWFALLPPERQKLMRYDYRLGAAAQAHAIYLSNRVGDQLLQSMHVGIGGSMPNGRVRAMGYRLPKEYAENKNNVESCARDGRDPATVAVSLANHEPHKSHMLGIDGFSDRTVWGCGSAGFDYVIVICPPEES